MRGYGVNYNRDDFTGNYDSDRGFSGNRSYNTRDYDRQRNYGSRGGTDRDDYRDDYREYRTYGGRAGGHYSDTGSSYGRGYDRSPSSDYEERDERGWWDKASDEVASWLGDEDAARRRRMDARNQGQHTGKGPKNYKRSDSRIEEDINDRLTYESYIDASDVTVSVENGEVTLTGTVLNRYAKRQVEDIAESVRGVTNVENRLRIKREDQSIMNATTSDTFGTAGFGRESMNDPRLDTTTTGETSTENKETKSSSKSKTA
jgi:osmotically-inducible protein OsmY